MLVVDRLDNELEGSFSRLCPFGKRMEPGPEPVARN